MSTIIFLILGYIVGGLSYAFTVNAYDLVDDEDALVIGSFLWPVSIPTLTLYYTFCRVMKMSDDFRTARQERLYRSREKKRNQ